MQTPGVYSVEKNAFPNSVVEVATAVPAFIGYTEKALNGDKSLLNKPFRITSIAEFRACFGEAPRPKFSFEALADGIYVLKRVDSFTLYYNMLLFYANGGGPCYIVSVGDYTSDDIDKAKLQAGIDTLVKEQEPTLLVIPEAVNLKASKDCYALQRAMLAHCGSVMKNRFAILDIYDGAKDSKGHQGDVINAFREQVGNEFLDYGAAYYPWINTSIVQEKELSFQNLDIVTQNGLLTDELSPLYARIIGEMRFMLNLLPISAAMAGVYALTDSTKGVWKAPTNVGIAKAVSPAVSILHEAQEELNVSVSGKSVNVIRSFISEGIIIGGARTLDGNSLNWRYINVRRTMIMLEESIKNALKAYVFEPNVATTWVNVKGMISNFLNGIWKRGGLAGDKPDNAYRVHVGLGETMTSTDYLEGIMRITVLVALVRPAEFIEITFQQQMQKS
jgi:phage tail sheath protein FI